MMDAKLSGACRRSLSEKNHHITQLKKHGEIYGKKHI